jgi:uncharacterized protein (DUF488 family)
LLADGGKESANQPCIACFLLRAYRAVNAFLRKVGAESRELFVEGGPMAELYTFGYEGLAIDAFIARLKSARVETVIDVRANPLSRKRGFSKTSFAIALRAAGIEYRHVAAMGCPKPVRDQYKEDGNWATYTRGFMRHLSKNGAALSEVAGLAKASTCCLVCFEANYEQCHRTFVARGAAKTDDFTVLHLTGQTVIPDGERLAAA